MHSAWIANSSGGVSACSGLSRNGWRPLEVLSRTQRRLAPRERYLPTSAWYCRACFRFRFLLPSKLPIFCPVFSALQWWNVTKFIIAISRPLPLECPIKVPPLGWSLGVTHYHWFDVFHSLARSARIISEVLAEVVHMMCSLLARLVKVIEICLYFNLNK